MHSFNTLNSPSRPLASGIVHWTTANTIPAGPQNAPPSPPRQPRRAKKNRRAPLRNFFRRESSAHDSSCRCIRCLQLRGELNIQLVEQSSRSFSPGTPRRAPTPPPLRRRRNSSPQITQQIFMPRPMARHNQTVAQLESNIPPATSGQPFKIPRKPLPPGALRRSQWLAIAAADQARARPQSFRPVSPVSVSAMNAAYDNEPISPISPTSPAISVTASEADVDKARANRMSTFSFLDGTVDLSAFAESPYAEKFAVRTATPMALTRAASSTVTIPARKPSRRTINPVPQTNAQDTVRDPSPSRDGEIRWLTLLSRTIPPKGGALREPPSHQIHTFENSNSPRSARGSVHYVLVAADSDISLTASSSSSSDADSLGSHAKILKRCLKEGLDEKSLIGKSFI